MDNQIASERTSTKKMAGIVAFLLALLVGFLVFAPPAHAEGTRDLTTNGGYRPYTERYDATTLGQQRLSVMHVYLKQGETVYLGTSVANAKLYNTNGSTKSGWLFSNSAMGTSYSDDQLTYLNTADVYVAPGEYANIVDAIAAGKTPGKNGVTLVDLSDGATNTTPGYIYDSAQEAGGIDLTGTGAGYKVSATNTISASTTGYVADTKTNANTFTASADGVYTVIFFSSAHTGDNPVKKKVADTTPFAQTQKGGTIASWDISVYSGSTLQTGRVFTSTLFINMGGNVLSGGVSQGSLYSDVYAVTDDGYQYKVDFNGMDPFGFVFFANNRGLLNTAESGSSSLYHGVRSDYPDLRDISQHSIALNNTPYDSSLDKTYNLFYEKPSAEALEALGIPTDPAAGTGTIDKFAFRGTGDSNANEGYVGKGGTFSFNASSNISATSYEIDLDFSKTGGGTVVLGNTLVKGTTNSIAWNGKDANGKIVPAGSYSTINASIKLKGGEVHFPLLDVEQNPNGIKISRLNGADPNSTIYFNNSATNAGDTTSPWTIAKNWEVGSQVDETTGVDSSNGAMAFTNKNTAGNAKRTVALLGDGDMCALDVWANYDRSVSLGSFSFNLVDTSFTVTKTWDDTAGTPTAGNPKNVKMTLEYADGKQVTTDATGAAIANPVTYDTSASATYTWKGLDPSKAYQVKETSITGYSTVYGDVTGDAANGYGQTVTNKYVPTKLTIAKVWNHGDEPQADWPTSVTVHVYADAAKTTEVTDSPFTLTATSADESGNLWAHTITGLDPTVSYYCYEDAVTGYTSSSGGKAAGSASAGYKSTFTNTFDSQNYVTAQVLKQWNGDTIDSISYRPTSVAMTLVNKDTGATITKDGLGKDITNPITLTDSNSWYYAWSLLSKTDTAGKTINYNIIETTPIGYTATTEPATPPLVLGNLTSVIWNNAYQPTSFTVNKTWDNGINANQPSSVSVQLEQSLDGGAYTDYGTPQTLDAAGNWAYTWTDLPSYASDGTLIEYKAVEAAVGGYATNQGTPAYVQEGTAIGTWLQTITNMFANTQLTITKTWDHGSQAEAEWPASVTFQMLANGKATGDSVILTSDDAAADGTWQKVVAGLPVNDAAGNPITYTVVETDVTGYTQSGGQVTGDATTGFAAAFTNTLQSTDITVTKTWEHGTQTQADWPTSVTMRLLANGAEVGSATLDAADSWKYTFTGQPQYDANGVEITYTVTEDAVSGYTFAMSKSGDVETGITFSATNTYKEPGADTTSFTATKTWDHGDQDSSEWPASITLQLYANGEPSGDAVEVTADDNWQHVWSGLAKQDAGSDIAYSVGEDTTEDYTTQIGDVEGSAAEGYTATITNTYVEPGVSPLTPDSEETAATSDFMFMIIGIVVAVLLVALVLVAVARRRSKAADDGSLDHRKHSGA